MDDNNFQNSLCITSMKQKLSGPTEAHGPFIIPRIEAYQNNPRIVHVFAISGSHTILIAYIAVLL